MMVIVGGTFTYSQVPLVFWPQEAFELSRNSYDKISRFMQGLMLAPVAREVLRQGRCAGGGLRTVGFPSLGVALRIGLVYEMVKWWVALVRVQGANEFLGNQGNPCDTQSDKLFALTSA